MKKTYYTLILFLALSKSFAQLPTVVNDPVANLSILEVIANGVTQIEQANQSIKLLKAAKKIYNKVNSALETVNYVLEMKPLIEKILKSTGNDLRELEKTLLFTKKEMGIITGNYQRLVTNGNAVFKVASNILSNDVFKMNDSERLEVLKSSKLELQQTLMDTRIAKEKYMAIARRRALRRVFKRKEK